MFSSSDESEGDESKIDPISHPKNLEFDDKFIPREIKASKFKYTTIDQPIYNKIEEDKRFKTLVVGKEGFYTGSKGGYLSIFDFGISKQTKRSTHN
jgi:hypothetical protein